MRLSRVTPASDSSGKQIYRRLPMSDDYKRYRFSINGRLYMVTERTLADAMTSVASIRRESEGEEEPGVISGIVTTRVDFDVVVERA